jgi:hypothetical protein
MNLSKDDYFFYEWLIVNKGMSMENFSNLSVDEIGKLRSEWKQWFDKQ